MSISRSGRGGRRKGPRDRKDRLIQTRVAGPLDDVLKREAAKRRLSVSHLIRNVLEDSFHLVDAVVTEVDSIVQDSVELAQQVRREVKTVARQATHAPRETANETGTNATQTDATQTDATQTDATREPSPDAKAPEEADFCDVYAWNPVVMNRPCPCASCQTPLDRGEQGHMGMTVSPGQPPPFLCGACIAKL